jgi:hypothetical protein
MEYRKIKKNFTHILLYLVGDADIAVQYDIMEVLVVKALNITNAYVLAYHASNATSCLPIAKRENLHPGHWHIYIYSQPAGEHSYDVADEFKHDEVKNHLTTNMDHELHAQQYTVHSPFSDYAQMSKTGMIIKCRGSIFEEFESLMKTRIGTLFPKLLQVKSKERLVWELRKQTALFGKEKQIYKILNGVHGSTMDHVIEIMERGIGYLNRAMHGRKFVLDVSHSEYKCCCGECSSSGGVPFGSTVTD